jgi:drug/metabolite transporter (DMT)-like permease
MNHSHSSVWPYLWMLSGSLSFACMATIAHALADSCDWQVIALARTLLAMVFAAALARAARAPLIFPGPLVLWMRSIAGSFSLVGTFYAFTRLPVSEVLTLTNLFPIWVALLSWPLLRELPSFQVWLSVAGGITGVVLILQPHFAEGNLATLVALGCSFFTAVAMMGLHQLQGLDPRAIVVHFSAVAFLFCLAALALFDRQFSLDAVPDGGPFLLLLGLGITATIGQLFLTKAFAAGPPAKVSVIGLSQIVFAAILEKLVTKRSFQAETLLGMGLVMVPTAWLMTTRGTRSGMETE